MFIFVLMMDHLFLSLLLATLTTVHPLPHLDQSTQVPESQITVEGSVYCDPCFNTRFSKYSYFMPGVDVHIQCKLKANPPGTAELISFSVNRSTDSNGVFKLEIPHVDGVDCVQGPPIQFSCQGSLIGGSSSAACNIPAVRTTIYHQLSAKSKSKQAAANQCIYSFPGMSFTPTSRNDTLCGKSAHHPPTSSKLSLPLRFPRPLSFSFSFSLPQRPPNPSVPFLYSPPPPPSHISLKDPRTWFPHTLFQPPPPPPMFNSLDPATWPPLSSPPPAGPLNNKP